MDDWVSIFSGSRPAAHGLAQALEREGLRAFLRHDLGLAGDLHAQPPLAHVLVPPEERERAERIATHWQTHHAARVEGLSVRLARVLATSLLVPAFWWLGAWALPERVPAPEARALGAAWLAGFVAIAQLESRRHRRERVEPIPASE